MYHGEAKSELIMTIRDRFTNVPKGGNDYFSWYGINPEYLEFMSVGELVLLLMSHQIRMEMGNNELYRRTTA